MKNPLRERPWLLVVLAFAVLVAAWAFLMTVAARNAPGAVPVAGSSPPRP